MSSAPAVAAYVVASLACSAITGSYFAGVANIGNVVQQPAVRAALDRASVALAERAVDSAWHGVDRDREREFYAAQPEPAMPESSCEPEEIEAECKCELAVQAANIECSASADLALLAASSVHQETVERLERALSLAHYEVWQWQAGTIAAIFVGLANWVWGVLSSRKLRAQRAEQARISEQLSDLASAISPVRSVSGGRRLSGASVVRVDLRRLASSSRRHGDSSEGEDSGSDSGSDANFDPLPWPEDVA